MILHFKSCLLGFTLCLLICGHLPAQTDCPRAEAPVSLNNPTLYGNGTPGSCTEQALQAAFDLGGEILCNCGPNPITLALSSAIVVTQTTIFDGNHLLTLDGQGSTRILYKNAMVDLTVQQTALEQGRAPGAPSSHFSEQCGGAFLNRQGGIIKFIDCTFTDNTVTSIDGSDIAGGAVYILGAQQAIFSGCTFENNSASNGGAIGGLGSDIIVANCLFMNNGALGNSGGLRGHGGAINLDGVELAAPDWIFSVCGSQFIGNHANKQGGACNTVLSDSTTYEIDQSLFEGNYLIHPEGNGGALFHIIDDTDGNPITTQFTIQRSSFIENKCNFRGGAIWSYIVGQGTVENCTFYRDSVTHPDHGLGGAIALSITSGGQGSYLIKNNTFAENYAGLWAGGVFANGAASVSWQNNILINNQTSHSNIWLDLNVNRTMNVDLGGNLQWPATKPSGDPATPATGTVQYAETELMLPPANWGGPTPCIPPTCTSLAVGVGNNCPSTDQRLYGWMGSCDAGAFQLKTTESTHMSVEGILSESQRFAAGSSLTSDASITTNANIQFMACDSTKLTQGFEILLGSTLEVH